MYKRQAKLYSNIPNPFKEQTTISFFIPETSSRASIHIYNLQGKQIKQLNIESRGNDSVTINGYELTPGMYMYSLIVDGQEAVSYTHLNPLFVPINTSPVLGFIAIDCILFDNNGLFSAVK